MAGNMTTAKPARRRGRGRVFFIGFLVVFGLGFYGGARTTRHVARSSPGWVQKIFGVEGSWLPTAPVVTNAPLPPVSPVAAHPAAPAAAIPDSPPPGAAAQPTSVPSPSGSAVGNVPQSAASAPAASSTLDQQVGEYNLLLRKAQDAYKTFSDAEQTLTANRNIASAESKAALERQNAAAADLQASVLQAQVLYDKIHASPDFAAKYKETETALGGSGLSRNFPEMSVDNLKFLRPH